MGRKAEEPGSRLRDSLELVYLGELGVREQGGENEGARVETYLRYVGLQKGNPWCAAFVSWSYGRIGFTEPRSGWSPALFPKARVIYTRGSAKSEKVRFLKGDIFGIWFGDKGRIAHVGFISRVRDDWITTVEGNTNEVGGREGDGVYAKRRPRSSVYMVARYIPAEP